MLISTMPRRVAAVLIAGATAVAFAAACGGGDSGSTGSTASNGNGGGGTNAFAAYTQCLQKNGVTITRPSDRAGRPSGAARPSGMPRPRPSGSFGARGGFPGGGGFGKPAGVDDATWQKAQSACASLRPSGGPGGFRGGGDNGANAAYRNCLQNHGVTLGQGTALNTADPATAKAIETCKVLRPTVMPTPAG
jgi:hypothetical protein